MRAVDTNVLVRLATRDNARQVAAAEAFVEKGVWISTIVLVEAIWLLDAVYGLDPRRLATTVEMFLNHRDLTLQDADVVEAALALYRRKPTLGFSDCLVLEIARKAGHVPLGTFDRTLGKVDGAERL
jgi:predicted nucleic-acid-binding protein